MIQKISAEDCIECRFGDNSYLSSNPPVSKIEVFYGHTEDFLPVLFDFTHYLSEEEKHRADKLHFLEDKYTYIACHGLLRMQLALKLKKNPSELIFITNQNMKPGLLDDPLYFNITHTKKKFAFAISQLFTTGIDMENIDRNIDFKPIIHDYFSNSEKMYLNDLEGNAVELFFLLWTRKEALLKAIGAGLVIDLKKVEVYRQLNKLKKVPLDKHLSLSNQYFIYSRKIGNDYVSVAIPQKTEIKLLKLTTDNCNI